MELSNLIYKEDLNNGPTGPTGLTGPTGPTVRCECQCQSNGELTLNGGMKNITNNKPAN